MVSSYTTNKQIEKPANGDYNNTWSTPVNSDWDIIDRAFGGTTTLNAVAASGTVTLTTNQYQAPIVAITGALTANVNYQLPAGVGGFWFVFNNTSGSFSILFSSAGGGSTVTLAQGRTTAVICDGTNVGLADTSVPSAAGSTTQVQYNLSGQLAGSSGFVFDGTNVGIGTTSLNANLHVANATTTDAIALFDNSNTTNVLASISVRNIAASGTGVPSVSMSQWRSSFAGNYDVGQLRFDGLTTTSSYAEFASIYASAGANTASGAPTALVFNTMNASYVSGERMRITAAGDVGIGTSSPGAKLEASISAASGERAIHARNTSTAIFAGATTALIGPSTTSTRFTHFNSNAGGTQAEFAIQKGDGSGGFSAAIAGYNYTSDFWYLSTAGTERLRITSTGGITSSDLADAVGYKGIPQNAKTASYTLALSDMGEHISITTGGVIIPANSSVAFPIGSAVSVYNDSGSNQTISITTDTLRLAGTASTGSRTLAQYGVATVLKVASTVWVISGAGVS